jgi:hypothetical protein
MSRLDIYKKQAKQLVRWHREGNYSIGGRIRGLARYQSLTDREALAREFSPENIAANRPIVDREPLPLSLSLRTIVAATSKTNERRIPRHWLQNAERVWVRCCVCGRGRSRTRRLDGEAGAGVCTAETEREETLLNWWPLVTRVLKSSSAA